MRSIPVSAQNAIIANVQSFLASTGFYFMSDFAQVISGDQEGLFGWITVNYAKNLLNTTNPTTWGALDILSSFIY